MQKHKITALCGYDIRCHYIALLFLSILKMCAFYLCTQIISVALLKFLLLSLSTSRAKNQCKRTYVIMISSTLDKTCTTKSHAMIHDMQCTRYKPPHAATQNIVFMCVCVCV